MKAPIISLTALVLLLSSCMKEEIPVPPYDRGNRITGRVDMGPTYKTQLWYDIGTNTVVKSNYTTDWDLAFDCSDNKHWVYLNTSHGVKAFKTNVSDIAAPIDRRNVQCMTDHPSGYTDSLGLGDWMSDPKVYIIDMGMDDLGNRFDSLRLLIEKLENGIYYIKYAKIDGTNVRSAQIAKNSMYNTVAFSMLNNQVIQIEPKKDEYDLCFTYYTHIFYEPGRTEYQVAGVLQNRAGVTVARDSLHDFNSITSEKIAGYTFSPLLDAVGYHWKDYLFSTGKYVIYSDQNYIIKDMQGFYYKLHFIDFYSTSGVKGSPGFEYQKL